MMGQVMIDIPYEVLYDTKMKNSEAVAFSKKMTALGYYIYKNVSLGYCAKIAGLTEEEFILFLGENKIDVFQFENDEELLRDIENA